MNTLLAPQRPPAHPGSLPHPPIPPAQPLRRTLADRIAMRIAVRLLLWSNRHPTDDGPHRARLHRAAQLREHREREWERRRRLLPLA